MQSIDDSLTPKKINKFTDVLLLILVFSILIPYIIIAYLIPRFLMGIFLRFEFTWEKIIKGNHIIFVYSNSRLWKEYIEQNIIPRINDQALILNWSDRIKWNKWSWPIRAFHHWGGDRDFNPLAIVYSNFVVVRIFRFYKPFHDYAKGKDANRTYVTFGEAY